MAFRFNLVSLANHIDQFGKEVLFHQPINIPTLFIKGSTSNYILPTDFDIIKTHFTNVQIDIIEKAGHWVHAENPTDFNQTVLNFLHLKSHL